MPGFDASLLIEFEIRFRALDGWTHYTLADGATQDHEHQETSHEALWRNDFENSPLTFFWGRRDWHRECDTRGAFAMGPKTCNEVLKDVVFHIRVRIN